MGRVLQHLRFAFRSLRRQPAFAVACAGVLSLGIAAVTTIFGITSGVLFRPLPYPDPDRLAFVLGSEPPGSDALPLTPAEFAEVRDQVRAFRRLVAVADDVAVVGGGADARSRRGLRVSPGAAEMLGAAVRLGRLPSAEEQLAGSDAVLVGEDLWRHDLGASPDVVGRTILLDGQPGRIVGVLAARARLKPILGFEPAWWRPLSEREAPETGRGARRLLVLGRLSDTASLDSAQAELGVLARRLAPTAGGSGWTLRATRIRDAIDPVAYVLVALVLLAILGIVCLNVGNLLLARALSRGREMAVRLALGAGRRDVFGQLLAEGVLVGLLGGVLGLVLTFGAVHLVRNLAAGTNAEALEFEVDAWVWAAALAASLLAGVLAGLAPALHWLRQDPEPLLKEGAHGATASPRSQRLKRLLIASEVALSMALLSQAGLALQSLRGLLALDRGFEARGALTSRLALPSGDSSRAEELRRRVLGLPGVRAAAIASALPAAAPFEPYRIDGGGPADESGRARYAAVSPGYFDALGIPLRAGRGFAATDAAGSLVAIVNDTLGRRLPAGAAALGSVIEIAGARRTVVGVVGTVRNAPLQVVARPEVYVPWPPASATDAQLLVATTLDKPLALAGSLADVLRAAPLREPPGTVRALEDTLSANMGVIRLGTILLGLVALGALALTAAGTYGVVSYLAAQRTRELGVRIALGAGPAEILRLVLKQGLRPVLAGTFVGALGAVALGRLLASRVHGLRPVEPAVLAGTGLVFVAVVALACYLPARRATRVDPAVTLRGE